MKHSLIPCPFKGKNGKKIIYEVLNTENSRRNGIFKIVKEYCLFLFIKITVLLKIENKKGGITSAFFAPNLP